MLFITQSIQKMNVMQIFIEYYSVFIPSYLQVQFSIFFFLVDVLLWSSEEYAPLITRDTAEIG